VPSPNILVVIADQQRAETVAPTSQCETPTLGALADDGTRFARCYAQNSICSPSRASFLTGTLPHTHGMVQCTHNLPKYLAEYQRGLDTWSRRLDAAGYHLGYAGKWHVERSEDLGQFGFDEHATYGSEAFRRARWALLEERDLEPPDRTIPQSSPETDVDRYLPPASPDLADSDLTRGYVIRQRGYDDWLLYGTHAGPPETSRDYAAFEWGVEFIRGAADRAEPWALVVAPYNPHDPFIAPESYYDRYSPDEIELPESFEDSLEDKPDIYARQAGVWADMDREHFREAAACYYATCSFLDDQVERLLEALRSTGQLTNTVVVYTSDHGDLLGAHRLLLKGAPAFEEAYRVPLIVSDPGRAVHDVTDHVCDHVVSLYDLAPTIAEWGGETLEDVPARSLGPLLDGADPDRPQEAYAEFHGQRLAMTQRILWRDRYKYVYHGAANDELYDLERDPHERDNLLAGPGSEHEEIAEEMAARVWDYCRQTDDDTLTNTNYPMYRFAPVGPSSRRE
jgi:arylsulfatase A-like enzyme